MNTFEGANIMKLKLTDITEVSAILYGTKYRGYTFTKKDIKDLNDGKTITIELPPNQNHPMLMD